MSVRVDLHMTGDQVSIADMVRFGRLAEDAGLGGVWTAEAWRDSLVPLAGVAAATSRIPLGTDVCQWTRTPVTMELAAADLDELSGGRFTLGLGTGPAEWNENWHGIPYERPLVRMREYVEAIRLLSQAHLGAPVTFEGEFFPASAVLGTPLPSPPSPRGLPRPVNTITATMIASNTPPAGRPIRLRTSFSFCLKIHRPTAHARIPPRK